MSDNATARVHGIQAGIAPGSRIGGYVVKQQADTTVSIPDSQHYTELDRGPGGGELLLGDPSNSQVSDFTRLFLRGSV